MKHIQLFEDFVNEAHKLKIGKEDFSYLLKLTDKQLVKELDSIRKQQDVNGKQYMDARSKGQNTSEIEKEGEGLANKERAVIQARISVNEINESQFKVGDNVIVMRKDGKEYTGKVEKLNPLKLRTSPSDTMVIPNAYIKDIVVKESVNEINESKKVHVENVRNAIEELAGLDTSRFEYEEAFKDNLGPKYKIDVDQITAIFDDIMGTNYEDVQDFAKNATDKDVENMATQISKYY